MALYNYKAITLQGQTVHGRIDALNLVDLEMRLKRMELDFIDAQQIANRPSFGANSVPRRELIHFCFHLEMLERANVPIIEGLSDLRDTLGELTHMLGGNLKSLLPAPSRVSLPVVAEHYNTAIAGRPAGRALLRCEGQPLQISLFEQECRQHENFDR